MTLTIVVKAADGTVDEHTVDLKPLFTDCDGTSITPIVDTRFDNPRTGCSSEGEAILYFDVINVATGDVIDDIVITIPNCEIPNCVEGLWEYDTGAVGVTTTKMYGDGSNVFSDTTHLTLDIIDKNLVDQTSALTDMSPGDTLKLKYTDGVDNYTATFQINTLFTDVGGTAVEADVFFLNGNSGIALSAWDIGVDMCENSGAFIHDHAGGTF